MLTSILNETSKVAVAERADAEPADSKSKPISGRQIAALPYRRGQGIEILVVTSRSTRRAVIPKGWRIDGLEDSAAAAREARQEAGLTGTIGARPFGTYEYWKRLDDHFQLLEVDVYPLRVTGQRKKWREKDQRRARWLSAADAALIVDEPALSTLITAFADSMAADAEAVPPAQASRAGKRKRRAKQVPSRAK